MNEEWGSHKSIVFVRRREDAFWRNGRRTVLWCQKSDVQAECSRLRSAVLRAGVTAGHVQWDKESSASCQGLLLSAQEAEGCRAVTFLRDFHLEHHSRAPNFVFSCWGVGTMQVQSLCEVDRALCQLPTHATGCQLYKLCQTWIKTNWLFSSYCGTDVLEVFFATNCTTARQENFEGGQY